MVRNDQRSSLSIANTLENMCTAQNTTLLNNKHERLKNVSAYISNTLYKFYLFR